MRIDICICTFQRESIEEMLGSLSAMRVPDGVGVRVIVADNDDEPSAKARVEGVKVPFDVTYIHAPARNISIARNACLDAAKGEFVVFVDDDEQVTEGWLESLVKGLEKSDAVFGPVRAVYGDDAPEWVRDEDYHSFEPVFVGGEILTGYTSNVIFRREADVFKGRRFREGIGRSGGEDTQFFAAAYGAGAKLVYASDAVVTEIVPPARARFSWLWTRRFRAGQTHGMLLCERDDFVRVKEILIAAGKAIFCMVVAMAHLLKLLDMAGVRRWTLRGALHMGVVARLMSVKELELYG